MITVHFPKYIRSLTNGVEKHNFDTDDIATVIKGLRLLFPDLSLYLSNIDSGNITNICFFIDKNTDETIKYIISTKVTTNDIVLIITIYGQGEDLGTIALGVALVAAGFLLGPSVSMIGVTGVLTGGSLITAGLSIALTGLLSAFSAGQSKANSPSDEPVRAQNDAFGALQNTTTTDTAIPLIFGQIRVAGQFVGGRIKTINHNAGDVISLANYVQ